LPNRAGACLVLQAPKWYWILYTKHQMKNGTNPGSVLLHDTVIDHFPIIGEFCYVAMIATLLFQKITNNYLGIIQLPFAARAIKSELISIEYS
jgi:hypothetical protein